MGNRKAYYYSDTLPSLLPVMQIRDPIVGIRQVKFQVLITKVAQRSCFLLLRVKKEFFYDSGVSDRISLQLKMHPPCLVR